MHVQIEGMEREHDGMRKALMLHAVLKALINRKLDRLVEQLQAQRDGAAVLDEGFETSLELLTTATKVWQQVWAVWGQVWGASVGGKCGGWSNRDKNVSPSLAAFVVPRRAACSLCSTPL